MERKHRVSDDSINEYCWAIFLSNLLKLASAVKRSWHVESYRAVVNVLATMDDERCPQNSAFKLLDQLQKLHREPHISMSHRHFDLATLAFVEIISGAQLNDFYDAIQTLRDIAKYRNEQYKHFFDEIKTLRSKIERHRRVIVCLEYRHVLEHLSREGEEYIVKQGRRKRPDLRTGTDMWQAAWELAVETELLKMCQEKDPPLPPSTSTTGSSASSTTAAQSSSQSAPTTLPPSPPILRSLLQKDFNVWSSANPTMCSDISHGRPINQPVQAAPVSQGGEKKKKKKKKKQKRQAVQGGQTNQTSQANQTPQANQTSQATASASDIPYRTWSSYAHGVTLYGDLSNEIHGYGRIYDIADEFWLETDMKVLEWLQPKVKKSEDEETVDWKAEWKERELPI